MKRLNNLELGEYLQILWKRRWYFLAAVLLSILACCAYAWVTPDVFKSETRIMVDAPFVFSDDISRPGARWTPEDRINSIREQLASRSFLERMIEQYQMYGFGSGSDFIMEEAVKIARKQIGIKSTSKNTFTISFVAADPQFAQRFTRQLAQELIRISKSSKKDKVLATDQFIEDQLRQSTEELAAKEQEIKRFKMAHLGELPEQDNANISTLAGLNSQLTATETAIQQAQERQKLLEFKWSERKRLNLLSQTVAAGNAGTTIEEIENLPSAVEKELASKRDLLNQYMAKYTSSYPDVVSLKRDIARLEQLVRNQKSASGPEVTASVPPAAGMEKNLQPPDQSDPMESSFEFEAESIKEELEKREKEKQDILKQIKTYQARLNLAPALEQELSTLLREEEVLKNQNTELQKHKFSSQLATTAETDKNNETYVVIDEANLPVKPQYPNRIHIVLIGFVGGIMLGIGAAFGREFLDSTIGSEEEAKRLLELPVLVTIPTVPKAKKKKTA